MRTNAIDRGLEVVLKRNVRDLFLGTDCVSVNAEYTYDAVKLELGKVLVNDRLVPKPLQRRITRLTQQPIWQYGWRSNPRRDRFAYWHVHFAGGEYDSRVDCESELASIPEIKAVHDLWKLLKAGHLKGHVPLRVYANGHTLPLDSLRFAPLRGAKEEPS
jgi:hypothetical protein